MIDVILSNGWYLTAACAGAVAVFGLALLGLYKVLDVLGA